MTITRTHEAHKTLRRAAVLATTTGLVLAGTAIGQAHAAPRQAPSRAVPAAGSVVYKKWAWATANVNVRTWATTSSKPIVVLGKGRALGVITTNTSKGWVKVNYKGRAGYIQTRYVKIASTGVNPLKTAAKPAASKTATCKASYYGEGSRTANGERFNPSAMTAAHKTYKFGTKLKVTNRANGRSVVVRINDRGPYVSGRCLDLSTGAFKKIASTSAGVATVNYQVVR
ncbi:Endolytic peptidoglycan transglycosylase RlpA [Acidipropionibacterium virtanenii]|uniref:Probable endolytic peptidoglycan transglycosylase RlpA n=1 Tax=Acidipropionibacterium virtanenii TaxID=2057246 RepID=A0A344UQU2_9ACTN|nr:septal ring lytic transglycosylase RlpA family protein [Acidipropionibacterium virtanenii]AXE37640.1 Endolytic peptidoglycan transglycosylase RlpA [Acidipropionibacterium virtanenii]